MASKKQGVLTTSGVWARHLRPLLRRVFWKRERQASRKLAREAAAEVSDRKQSSDASDVLGGRTRGDLA